MARHLIPKTLTIRPDQARYMENVGLDNREQSRWFRGAIDERIDREKKVKEETDKKLGIKSPDREVSQ